MPDHRTTDRWAYIRALNANRDWWRKRAEELQSAATINANDNDELCRELNELIDDHGASVETTYADAINSIIERFQSQNAALSDRIRDLEQQVARQMAIRPSVASFASMMENTLRKHDAKKGGQANWRKDTHDALLRRLHDEIDEVDAAVLQMLSGDSTTEDVVKELVDVANFALMCVDVLHPLACDSITPPSVTAGADVREGVEYRAASPVSDYESRVRWKCADGVVMCRSDAHPEWNLSGRFLGDKGFRAAVARGELVPATPPEVKP